MADGRTIKDYVRKFQKVHDVLNQLTFAFMSEFNQHPDIIILSRDAYYDFRNEYFQQRSCNGEEEMKFNGIKVVDSNCLEEKQIEIY